MFEPEPIACVFSSQHAQFQCGIDFAEGSLKTTCNMFRNYLKIALRSLFRTKVYSLINILGLSLGIACCLLLTLYVQDELEYDRHHERLNDLYRIGTEFEGVVGFDKLGS